MKPLADHAAEAQRQQAVLQTLWRVPGQSSDAAQLAEQNEPLQRGLAAYRGNACAIAERSLAASHPTVQALLGEEDFAALARELWRHHPPQCGDLGEWGAALPGFIEAHTQLQAWPYLADCARLDWAVHQCERAANAALDQASLALLSTLEPSAITLQLMPGLHVLASAWPIAFIHAAHDAAHRFEAERSAAFNEARTAIAASQGQSVVVYRSGWRAQVQTVDAANAAWMQSLAAGATLEAALQAHQRAEPARADGDPQAGFDFSTWLPTALSQNWLWRVQASSKRESD